MTILQHWANGRSIEWIAAKMDISTRLVVSEIRSGWGEL